MPGEYDARNPFFYDRSKHCALELHKPSAAVADRLGYPRPLIEHEKARERALRRYKSPGKV